MNHPLRFLSRHLGAHTGKVLRLAPHITVATPLPPLRSDAYWDRVWREGVQRREDARLVAELERIAYLIPQAE